MWRAWSPRYRRSSEALAGFGRDHLRNPEPLGWLPRFRQDPPLIER
jgi:hypothetical protein